MQRPTLDNTQYTAMVTTPHAASLIRLLGGAHSPDGMALTLNEHKTLQKLYGYTDEKPNTKPDPPQEPKQADFKTTWDYNEALAKHERELQQLARWEDPRHLMQAGADSNMLKHAELDGLRLLAWIAQYTSKGEDPLKTLVRLAIDSGWDVCPEDVEWVEEE